MPEASGTVSEAPPPSGCVLYYRPVARPEQGAATMTEKSTFARRVRASRPLATKYEARDDVVSRLAPTIQPTGVRMAAHERFGKCFRLSFS